MSQRPSSPSRGRRGHAHARHGRLYVFLVVALAVFLGAIVLWQEPPSEFTARVALRHRSGEGETPAEAIAQAISSDLALHDAAKASGQPNWTRNTKPLRARLRVEVSRGRRPGEAAVQIWFVDASAEQAKAMADGLANRYVQTLSDAQSAPVVGDPNESLHARVREAQAAVELAEEQWSDFLAQNAGQSADTDSPAVDRTSSGDAERPHPKWVDLNDRLQVLRAAREELLAKRTAAHPEVQDLQWQIKKLEAEQAATPRTVAPANISDAQQGGAPPAAPVFSPRRESAERYRELQTRLQAARRRLESARQDQVQAASPTEHQTFSSAEVIEPARIVSYRGGGVSRGGLWFAAALAVAVGLLATWQSQAVEQPAVLISRQQVESLGVPVVAAISTRDGPALPQPHVFNPGWVRWMMLGCELALAAVALAMLLLALAEWKIAAGLLRDPLSTFSEAVRRLAP